MLGFPVDAVNWLLRQTGLPVSNAPIGGSESIKSAFGLVGADPRKVIPADETDRLARAVGEGTVSMAVPYMGGRAMIAHGIEQGLPGAIASMLGGPAPAEAGAARTLAGAASNATIGGGGAATGLLAENAVPEPYKPLANLAGNVLGGGLLAGGMGLGKAAINAAANQARETLGPLSQSYREGLVGERLRAGATDPSGLVSRIDDLRDLVPGSVPTLYQATGDQGVGQLERGRRTLDPAPFLDRAAEQNQARVTQLGTLAPRDANPGAVRDLFRQQLAAVDQSGEANVAAAQANANQAMQLSGGQLSRDEYGALMRDQLEAAKAANKQEQSRLWSAIDPDGTLTINATPVLKTGQSIREDIAPVAKPPEGEEARILEATRMLGTATPFRDYTALRSDLLAAIRQERMTNGETQALRRMQMLRQSIDDTMSGQIEQGATTGASPTFDAAAQERYRAAADATRTGAETFKNQTVGPVLTAGRNQPYRVPDVQVPEKFIGSPQGVAAYTAAGGDPATLQAALVGDLRRTATAPDGSLDVGRYQSWLSRRADALRAFPDLQQQLGTVAQAQGAVDTASGAARQQTVDFQQSAARHFLNAEPTQAVQSALGSKNASADFAQLARMVQGNPDAQAGLQRAVADYINQRFIGNTEAGTSGLGTVRSDQLQEFVKRNGDALTWVMGADRVQALRDIAADLQRSNRSIASSKIPGQSNTAQDIAAAGGVRSFIGQHLGQGALTAGGALTGYLVGDLHGAATGAGAGVFIKQALDKLKAAGIDRVDQLTTEALLNPELARTLLVKPTPGNAPFIAQRLSSHLGTLAGSAAVRSPAMQFSWPN